MSRVADGSSPGTGGGTEGLDAIGYPGLLDEVRTATRALARGTHRRYDRGPTVEEVERVTRWVVRTRTQEASLDLALEGLLDLAWGTGTGADPDAMIAAAAPAELAQALGAAPEQGVRP
jgi:hypothetical protein